MRKRVSLLFPWPVATNYNRYPMIIKIFKSLLVLFLFNQLTFANENALDSIRDHGFSQSDIEILLLKFPELTTLDIAYVEENSEQSDFSINLFTELANDVYTIKKSQDSIDIYRSEARYDIDVEDMEGEIQGTLYETILSRNDSKKLANVLSSAFSEEFSTTTGLKSRATYNFQVIKYYVNNQFIKYGDVLKSTLIIGHALSSKTLQMSEGENWKLLPEEFELTDKPFYPPVKLSRISSFFQLNRRHPVTRKHQPHNGVDFVAASGTPVYPAMSGKIIAMTRTRSKGKYVTILHDNGYQTSYMHLKNFQKGLRVGKQIELEDQIGEVGRTGFATGTHLHFAVIKDGFFINPLHLLKNYGYDQKDHFENLEIDFEEDSGLIEE